MDLIVILKKKDRRNILEFIMVVKVMQWWRHPADDVTIHASHSEAEEGSSSRSSVPNSAEFETVTLRGNEWCIKKKKVFLKSCFNCLAVLWVSIHLEVFQIG